VRKGIDSFEEHEGKLQKVCEESIKNTGLNMPVMERAHHITC
jgi:hypothetical protein